MRDIFFGPATTKLHGVLTQADSAGAPAVVLCHPHPQYGGNMNNNVVLGVEKEIVEAGFTSLRFNFRGVGRSEGSFDGGAGEKSDVLWAIDALTGDETIGPVVVAGYSFGAVVALPVAVDDDRIAAMAGISPPTVMANFDFLANTAKRLLLIIGSADEYSDIKTLKSTLPKNGKIETLPGVDHFYIGHELRAGQLIADFIKQLQKDGVIKKPS